MLLRKGIYPYEYMDAWKKFNQDKLPPMKNFYSELTMENITNSDYRHAQIVFKNLIIKTLVITMIYMFKVMSYYLLMYLKILETNA